MKDNNFKMKTLKLKEYLNENIILFLKELFPNGKIIGTNFKIGSLQGEKGNSLSISLLEGKIGIWSDFST